MSEKEPKYPAYQHWPKDFNDGTAGMSCTEVGAYIRLLNHAWGQDPVATLPTDSEQLRRMAGADKEEWKTIEPVVLAKFTKKQKLDGDRWVNEKLRSYYDKLREQSEEASERGKKGAAGRWGKNEI